MRALFALLWKYQFLVLFIVLEVICYMMLINSYSYHKSLTFNSVNNFTGGIFSTYSSVSDYFSLKQENQKLREENAGLRNNLKSSFLYSDTSVVYVDSLYEYIPAKVVSISVSKANNFIMIDKGSLHGIEKEMGVISSTGLAGIVIGTSGRYAVVMSMLHQNSRISGRIKKNNQLINVVWKGWDYRKGLVIDIPSHVNLNRNDTIVTSGNSLIFPEGILIGTVITQNQNESQDLGEATMAFSTDFNSLKHVYVIRNLMRSEQINLEIETADE
jgi:rod shape-determining protein MreC